jgi:hypothetical protein
MTSDMVCEAHPTQAWPHPSMEHLSGTCPGPGMPHPTITRLRGVVAAYNDAADKFIAKVESGRARSQETYADLKACRALALTEAR